MRLIFSDDSGLHLLAVDLPNADALAEIKRIDPKSSAVFFGGNDTTDERPWKVSRRKLLSAGLKLANLLKDCKEPRVRGILLQLDNGTSYGPSKGTTGFSVNGIPAMAMETISGNFIIEIGNGDASEVLELNGISEYRVDQGAILVEYTTANSAFAEMVSRLDSILMRIKKDNVWLHIEY